MKEQNMFSFKTFSTAALLGGASVVSAAESISLQDLLSASVLDQNQTKVETQVYAASRVVAPLLYQSVAEWENFANDLRKKLLDKVVLRGEARQWDQMATSVEWSGTVSDGPGYRIRKLRYEAIPNFWIPALLYEPSTLAGRVPVVLNVNGHEKEGKAVANKQNRCINLAKKGMLALSIEWFGMGQLSTPDNDHYRSNQLDLCGTSGLALHYLALRRGIDILLALDHADPERLAVTGLSGGSWQTIFITSLDTRVRLANPVAGYSSYLTRAQFEDDLGDSEQTPTDFASLVDYVHLTSLVAPRPLLLTHNAKDDCCFRADYALGPLLSAARPIYGLYKQPERLRYHINHDLGHNYGRDNREAFYRMLKEFFFAEKQDFSSLEVISDSEVRSSEDLSVPLPSGNLTFHSVATKLSQYLPRQAHLPASGVQATAWQELGRADLFQLVRAKSFKVHAVFTGNKQTGGLSVHYWKLKMDNAWTVPVVELTRDQTTKTTRLVVADEGRVSTVETVGRLLAQGNRVIAVDPFYFGESRLASKRDFLYSLLLASLGDRPLGIQASQLMAVAQWFKQERGLGPVSIEALGERASLAALVSAGLDRTNISGLSLHSSLASLKEVIERNLTAKERPEFFCFGLLERFDIKQLIALVAPRPVQVVSPGDRTRREFFGLREFYSLLGTNFNPLD